MPNFGQRLEDPNAKKSNVSTKRTAAKGEVDPNYIPPPPSPTAAAQYGGFLDPNGNERVDTLFKDPNNYEFARDHAASQGRGAGKDPRNYWIGRSETGAQDMRDYATQVADNARMDAKVTSGEAVRYGEKSLEDSLDRAGNIRDFGQGSAIASGNAGNDAFNVAQDYSTALDGQSRSAMDMGRMSADQIRSTTARGVSALHALPQDEGPSGADAMFGLSLDQAIQQGARTGDRAGVAETTAQAATDAAKMRASEYNAWRDRLYAGGKAGQELALTGATTAGAQELGGLRTGADLSGRGAGVLRQGGQLLSQGTQDQYNTLATSEALAGSDELSGYGNLADGYINAADADAAGYAGVYGASDLTQAIDEMELRGSMTRRDDVERERAIYAEYERQKKDAEEAKRAAAIGGTADAAGTLATSL